MEQEGAVSGPTWRQRMAMVGHGLDRVLRVAVATVACAVIAGSIYVLGAFIVTPDRGEAWTVGLRPNQFYAELDHDRRIFSDDAYSRVLGVAHNSGGSTDATLEAVVAGADVIEADVAMIDGVLYVAHDPLLPFLGQRWFRGPRLDRLWAATYGAPAVMLDLKESSPAYLNAVVDFLSIRQRTRQVYISSRSPGALAFLKANLPEVSLLLSVPGEAGLRTIINTPSTLDTIDGISVRATVLNQENAAWLTEHHLLIFAWTVNDLDQVNELMRWGVDGITSDNLAIVSLVSGEPDRETPVPATPIVGKDE